MINYQAIISYYVKNVCLLSRESYFDKVYSIALNIIHVFRFWLNYDRKLIKLESDLIFVVSTENHLRILDSVVDKSCRDYDIVDLKSFGKMISRYDVKLTWLDLYELFKNIFFLNSDHSIYFFRCLLIHSYFSNFSNKKFVFFNDHGVLHRSVFFSVNEKNRTFYIPHAEIYYHFDPIRFNVFLLRNKKMIEIYGDLLKRKFGQHSCSLLNVGDPTVKFMYSNKKEETVKICVAVNYYDDVLWFKKIEKFSNATKYEVFVKIHPRNIKARKYFSKAKVKVVEAIDELYIFALVISDVSSSIVFDCLYRHIPVYILSSSNENYGLESLGLPKIDTLEEIERLEKFETYRNDQYESYNPNSSQIILSHLNE